jgi:aerobic-type carbon monoxide dehydrogenase small subunit (CoxS/CutS family)
MRLTMKEKLSVIAVLQEKYRKSGKKLKRQILDECCRLTGYNRAYASNEA